MSLIKHRLPRRRFLQTSTGLLIAGATGQLGILAPASAATIGQPGWRFCSKCFALFYNGYPDKGRCPAGGAHVAQGFDFVLPYGRPETPTDQAHWRFCTKCSAMFFNGYPNKGHCPAGGAHVAQGFNFTLPHDVAQTAVAQRHWRFCNQCGDMFFNGYPSKGVCPSGGAHLAQGFNFVLPHPTLTCASCNDGSCQCGYSSAAQLCAAHRGHDPELGCQQIP